MSNASQLKDLVQKVFPGDTTIAYNCLVRVYLSRKNQNDYCLDLICYSHKETWFPVACSYIYSGSDGIEWKPIHKEKVNTVEEIHWFLSLVRTHHSRVEFKREKGEALLNAKT